MDFENRTSYTIGWWNMIGGSVIAVSRNIGRADGITTCWIIGTVRFPAAVI
jgi:hypothetical protein